MKRWLASIAMVALAAPSPARAQMTDSQAAADALFREGRDLMKAGALAEACPKLAKSLELDPALGTKFRLAECYEQIGRLASAWQLYTEAADEAGLRKEPDRERVARERATSLRPRLSSATLDVESPAPGLVIRKDGAVVPPALWGVAVPADAGELALEASAPGRATWRTRTMVPPGARSVIVAIPALAPGTASGEVGPLQPADESSLLPFLGVGTAGLGVAAMATGVVLGVVAKGQYDAAESCAPGGGCDAAGFDERVSARGLGDVGTGVFIGGAVVAAAGVVMLIVWGVTAPDARAEGVAEVLLGGGRATPVRF